MRAFGTRKSVYLVLWKTVLRRETTCGRYIQVLPQPDDSSQPAIPLVWHDEDISWLRGTHLEEAVKSRRKDLKRRWREAIEVMKHAGWDVSCYTMFVGFSNTFHIVSFIDPAIGISFCGPISVSLRDNFHLLHWQEIRLH